MATGLQIEDLTQRLANQLPRTARERVADGLIQLGAALTDLVTTKALVDTVVADATAASKPDYEKTQIQADWSANLLAKLTGFSYSGKSGINALAQLLADLSTQTGLEAGVNRLRLHKGQAGSSTIVAVTQDA